jgi:ferrous iron transport protein B
VSEALRVAVAGNPNVGKTSLFNVLTGSRHQVGNYAGVTVEKVQGALARRFAASRPVQLTDLPGMYSLTATSADEEVAFRALTGGDEAPPDVVLVVLDATNLARNLYLALQILELGVPAVVALNMVDLAAEVGLAVEPAALERLLGVPVVPTNARMGEGAEAVVAALPRALSARVARPSGEALDRVRSALAEVDDARAHWLVTTTVAQGVPVSVSPAERGGLQDLDRETLRAAAEELVRERYAQVDRMLDTLGIRARITRDAPVMTASQRIDRVLTHKVGGLAAFVVVMAVVFISIFAWADPIMSLIEDGFGGLSELVRNALGPGLFTDLVCDGVIMGVGNVLVFVPQIALLFLFLGLLEDSGYLARAAFLLDRLMSRLGLHGRAFVPLLSGYACAIPAIMGTRTIGSFKDRMVTILMIPFMSCSARLPIYGLIIGALVVIDDGTVGASIKRGLVLLSMYVLSTLSALAMGFVYKRTILASPTPPLVLELPPYRWPRWSNTLLVTYDRVRDFVRGAGTMILAMTVVLWAVLSFPREDTGAGQDGPTQVDRSWGGRAAQTLEPALEPIGQDWRVGVGILGSFAAREVLVSTLGLVYGMEADEDDPRELREALAQAKDERTGGPRYTALSGIALMVFFVYACQCMSTLAVVRRETRSWKWPVFMFTTMTAIAYGMALLVYQGGRALGF